MKAKQVIGLPVIELGSGKRLGQVKDLLVDGDFNVRAILVEPRQLFSASRAILTERIAAVGEDAVMISDRNALQEWDESGAWHSFLNGTSKIKGLPVITSDGQELGSLEDVYFEAELGNKITRCELTDGLISDLKEGRKWLAIPERFTVGEDSIIVPFTSTNE